MAEVNANYNHLPPQEKLVHPAYDPGATQYKGPWDTASELATAAYDEIRAEVDRLGPRLRRDLADRWSAEPTDRLVPLDTSSGEIYLATKSTALAGLDAGDLYRYTKGNPEALHRIERLMSGRTRPTKWVTPGYHWWMARVAADTGRRESVEITLTVNRAGVARLRCGKVVVPATVTGWRELTADALPRSDPPRKAEPHRPARPSRWQRVAAEFSSADGWIGLLLIALVVSVVVVIVMALFRL
ncbi:hypothetical protein ABZS29_26985 [Kribbella sp. NPDC005582]|uniref:hypothetical protein n=1 Tax=Kribbella sp. NPDC005582 TaxID=3156893 RepID=UPI0033B55DD0